MTLTVFTVQCSVNIPKESCPTPCNPIAMSPSLYCAAISLVLTRGRYLPPAQPTTGHRMQKRQSFASNISPHTEYWIPSKISDCIEFEICLTHISATHPIPLLSFPSPHLTYITQAACKWSIALKHCEHLCFRNMELIFNLAKLWQLLSFFRWRIPRSLCNKEKTRASWTVC